MEKKSLKRRVISICGPSGGGKSFMVKKFTNYTCISTDDFYIGKSQMMPNERGEYNFDNPEVVNLEACKEAVEALASLEHGNKVIIPNYDMKTSEPKGTKAMTVPNEKAIVIIEGIFAFHSPLLELADFRIFVEPPPEIILARRFKRDIYERGRTPLSILKQYPMVIEGYEQYIRPRREFADVIIDFGILV